MQLKTILTAVLCRRNGYHLREKRFRHNFGTETAPVFLQNSALVEDCCIDRYLNETIIGYLISSFSCFDCSSCSNFLLHLTFLTLYLVIVNFLVMYLSLLYSYEILTTYNIETDITVMWYLGFSVAKSYFALKQ